MTTQQLPALLDTAAAGALRGTLIEQIARGKPLMLDGGKVEQIGLACLQVLASARATAQAGGLSFTIERPSEALRRMSALSRLSSLLEPAR